MTGSEPEPVAVGSDNGPVVAASNRSGADEVDVERWARVGVETLRAENVLIGQLDLTFVGPDEMAELNQTHMGHDGPTDVLSFPLDGEDDGGFAGDEALPVLLGDVVVCPQVAFAQAPEHGGDPDTELTLLVVHGVLHILGHDHAEAEEAAVMIGREIEHLRRYGMDHPGPVRPESPPQ